MFGVGVVGFDVGVVGFDLEVLVGEGLWCFPDLELLPCCLPRSFFDLDPAPVVVLPFPPVFPTVPVSAALPAFPVFAALPVFPVFVLCMFVVVLGA